MIHWRRRPAFDLKAAILVIIIGIIMLAGGRCAFGFELSIKKVLKLGAGIATSVFLVHEGGHLAVLEARDRKYGFYLDRGYHPSFTYEGETDESIQRAGLIANMLTSSVILSYPKEKRGPYLQGVVIGNALEQILYPALRYNSGDFKQMRGKGKTTFAALSVGHGLFSLFRLYSDGQLNISSWVGISGKGTPMGGFTIRW